MHPGTHVTKTKTINIYRIASLALLALGTGLIASNARAELRCDCSQIVETCSAEITFDDNEIEIESSEDACSRVDYLIDGQPYSALVVDGEAEFNWEGQPQSSPQIVVENCRVCADSVKGNVKLPEPAAVEEAAAADAQSRSLVKVMPNFPRKALTAGLEGSVTVEFDVNEEGVVQNMRVTESTDGVFITPAIDAASRFRFTPGEATKFTEQFTFKLLNGSNPTVTSATL
jgi:TonB family protein